MLRCICAWPHTLTDYSINIQFFHILVDVSFFCMVVASALRTSAYSSPHDYSTMVTFKMHYLHVSTRMYCICSLYYVLDYQLAGLNPVYCIQSLPLLYSVNLRINLN